MFKCWEILFFFWFFLTILEYENCAYLLGHIETDSELDLACGQELAILTMDSCPLSPSAGDLCLSPKFCQAQSWSLCTNHIWQMLRANKVGSTTWYCLTWNFFVQSIWYLCEETINSWRNKVFSPSCLSLPPSLLLYLYLSLISTSSSSISLKPLFLVRCFNPYNCLWSWLPYLS